MDGPRHIWWNFVSSSKEPIAQAAEDWRQRRFALVAAGDALPVQRHLGGGAPLRSRNWAGTWA
jgi:Pirin C-terminal cupin domain